MATPLLTTKLYIPPPRPNLVPRPRLIERLNEGVHGKLTLISAPAGSGKTTLVSEWVSGGAREVAWLSLDEGDNDPVQFLTYLIAALRQIDRSIGQTLQPILQSPQLPPSQSLVTPLVNDVTAAATALTLVLDDYHLITSPAVHQVLGFLLENQPPSMHLVISTRGDPPLPLTRLRARGQVAEMRERDLRFTAEEVAAFLNQTMGLRLSSEAVAALEARTEGWIAGLQLAALALQEEHGDTQAFIAAFTGSDRYVMDYLVAEVLQRQPETVRGFLRQTAILDRLTAPLCDAVTGREDSQAMLEQLDAANLFVVSLDHRREWYRYHRFFAEALRATLDQEEQKRLHQRAARWHEAHGFMSQAIQHALTSQNMEDAERLIRLTVEETILGGGVLTVRAWLDALPDARVRASGALATYRAWVLALSGEMALAEDYADAAEARLRQAGPDASIGSTRGPGPRGEAPPTDLGKLLALRSFIALMDRQDYEAATELAAGALQGLKEGQTHWRVIALWVMAEALERTRSITEAIDAFRQARRTGLALGDQIFVATVEISLASALNTHGQRQEAVAVCQEAIERHTDEMGRTLPLAGLIFSRLGILHYEANQLEQARRCHERGVALGEQFALGGYHLISQAMAAPTLCALGETEAALAALQKAYQFTTQTGLGDADWYLDMEVSIRLQQGDLAFVRRWAETAGLSPDDDPQYLRVEQHLGYGRLLLVQDQLSDARRWLDRLEHFTRERGLYRWLISVHIQQALAAERSGDHPAAHGYLSRALEMAAPEDYYRAFLDEDARVIALLPAVRRVTPAFVDQLLDYAGVPQPGRQIAAQPLVEPLSERELEVLRLIAAGFSNAEIAGKLFIAQGTVKRHINNIYGKLEVQSRTQAVASARELDLL